jgi:adenine/guanine phosphoribosyltransferase-like PRPP-binding protein
MSNQPTNEEKVSLDFETISRALQALILPPVDMVVGIAEGGTVPAALLAHQLGLPLRLLRINYRAADNSPQRPAPSLLMEAPAIPPGARILLVDDVSVSGQTLALARDLLPGCLVTTLTLKGRADFVLFPHISACVIWPWKG